MGYYIDTDGVRGKADWLIEHLDGEEITAVLSYDEIPADKALVVVVENITFEAACHVYDKFEFLRVMTPREGDFRSRRFVLVNKGMVYKESRAPTDHL